MKLKDRKRLMAKSLLCFGRTSRYNTMMRRGRVVTNSDGTFSHTAPITPEEIEDTMDYILAERKKNQQKMEEEYERLRVEENEQRGSDSTQPTSSTEATGQSNETSETSGKE